jgi:hypothetical protein
MPEKAPVFMIAFAALCASATAGDLLSIPAVPLINQHGQPVNAATELTGGGVASVGGSSLRPRPVHPAAACVLSCGLPGLGIGAESPGPGGWT